MFVIILTSCGEAQSASVTTEATASATATASVTATAPAPYTGEIVHILIDKQKLTNGLTNGSDEAGTLGNQLEKMVKQYNATKRGKVEIDYVDVKKDYSNVYQTYESIYTDKMYLAYRDRLERGEEPDIIVFSASSEMGMATGGSLYTEWYKYIQNDYLADLKPYMDADESYDSSDYVGAVMNGGKLGEQQYFLPLLYQIWWYGGTYEKAGKTGAPTPETFKSFDDFWKQVSKTSDYAKEKGMKLFSNVTYPIFEYFPLYADNMTMNITNGAFKEDTALRTMLKVILDQDDPSNSGADNAIDGWQRIDEEEKMIYTTSFNTYSDIDAVYGERSCLGISPRIGVPLLYNISHRGRYGSIDDGTDTTYIRGLPSYSDPSKHNAAITLAMGVSASSKHKQSAYDFIKYCLDNEDVVESITMTCNGYLSSYPVNRKALENMVFNDEYMRRISDGGSDRVVQLGTSQLERLTSLNGARPVYLPFYNSFEHNFRDVYMSTDDRSDVDALIDEMYDAIDSDMEIFWRQ